MHAYESGLLVTFFQNLPSLTIIHARLNLQANLSETVSDCYMKQDALDAPGPVVDACPVLACFLTLPVLVYFSLYNPPSHPDPDLGTFPLWFYSLSHAVCTSSTRAHSRYN